MRDKQRKTGRPTVASIAKAAGVSRSTVSHILNQKEPFFSRFTLETRRRVIETAQEMGYPVARELRDLWVNGSTTRRRQPTRTARIADVAKRAGVSKTTASYILSNSHPYASQFSEETRLKVLQAAVDVGYSANVLAAGLVRPGIGLIGVYIGGASFRDQQRRVHVNPMAFQLIEGINQTAQAHDLLPVVRLSTSAADRADLRVVKRLRRAGVSGLLLHAPSPELIHSLIEAADVPSPFLILLGSEHRNLTPNWVDLDNCKAGAVAARLLLDRGHTRVAVLSEEGPTPYTLEQRLVGVREAFAERGLTFSDTQIWSRNRNYSTENQRRQEREFAEFFRHRGPYSAVICLTSGLSDLALRMFHELGLRLPEDCDLVAFDLDRVTDAPSPELNSIRLDWAEAARLGTERLLEMIEQGSNTTEPILLPPMVAPLFRTWGPGERFA